VHRSNEQQRWVDRDHMRGGPAHEDQRECTKCITRPPRRRHWVDKPNQTIERPCGHDGRHPGIPTEPSDMPKGMRRQVGELRVEMGHIKNIEGAKCGGDELSRPRKPPDESHEQVG